ncbi:MAG: IS982 family transposase [Eubacteriales bacterium]|nr:IS982 family transposase [Eubacteriales bacterium]
MLKFQGDYTTIIATFEDFILLVYTIIDDLYHQFAPTSVSQRRNVDTAKMSDSEIITLSICGELAGIDSENAWYSFVKRNYRHLFPRLCSRTRFNRTRKALLQVTELLRQKLTHSFPIPTSRYFVIDSFPLPVCKFGRARYCRSFRVDGANYGKCPSKKETYFGFKVHALITIEGYITAFEITPASVDDREGLRDFAENHLCLTVLGDKGYTGEQLWEDMQEKGICLMSLKPSNHKNNWPKEVRQVIFRFRRRIETVFSQLSEQLNAEKVLAKSFRGLCTRLQNKILGHNLCMAFNSIFREPCDIGKIKHLIF